jgi:hypothetical protein
MLEEIEPDLPKSSKERNDRESFSCRIDVQLSFLVRSG